MKPGVVLLALGAAVVGVAAASSSRKGRPLSSARDAASHLAKFDRVKGPPAEFRVGYAINPTTGVLELSLDGEPVIPPGTYWGTVQNPAFGSQNDPFGTTEGSRLAVTRAREFAKLWQQSSARRQALLPADASKMTDKYSKELYGIPAWVTRPPEYLSAHDLTVYITGILVDEFGRLKPGQYGSGGGILDTFTNLLKNPLFQAVLAGAALAFGGPVGLAAYGAFNAYVINGQEITPKNLVLSAARTYAVSQCGPVCGMAFDIGVGVANGRSVDEVAVEAALSQMSPEERAAYEQGRQLYEQNKGSLNL